MSSPVLTSAMAERAFSSSSIIGLLLVVPPVDLFRDLDRRDEGDLRRVLVLLTSDTLLSMLVPTTRSPPEAGTEVDPRTALVEEEETEFEEDANDVEFEEDAEGDEEAPPKAETLDPRTLVVRDDITFEDL